MQTSNAEILGLKVDIDFTKKQPFCYLYGPSKKLFLHYFVQAHLVGPLK